MIEAIFAIGFHLIHQSIFLEIRGLNTVVFPVAISHIFRFLHSFFSFLDNKELFSFHIVFKKSSKVIFSRHFHSSLSIASLILVKPFDLGQIIHSFVGCSCI